MMMKTMRKRFEEMTTAELHKATAEFESELPVGHDELPGRPMNRNEQQRWNRMKKKIGRPRIGKGVKRVMISMEAQLLKDSDAFARKNHLNRSQLIAAGLRQLMAG